MVSLEKATIVLATTTTQMETLFIAGKIVYGNLSEKDFQKAVDKKAFFEKLRKRA